MFDHLSVFSSELNVKVSYFLFRANSSIYLYKCDTVNHNVKLEKSRPSECMPTDFSPVHTALYVASYKKPNVDPRSQ